MNRSTTLIILENSPQTQTPVLTLSQIQQTPSSWDSAATAATTDSAASSSSQASQLDPISPKLSFRSYAIGAIRNIARIQERLLLPRQEKLAVLHEGTQETVSQDGHQMLSAVLGDTPYVDPMTALKQSRTCPRECILGLIKSACQTWLSSWKLHKQYKECHFIIFHADLTVREVNEAVLTDSSMLQQLTDSSYREKMGDSVPRIIIDMVTSSGTTEEAKSDEYCQVYSLDDDSFQFGVNVKYHSVSPEEILCFSTRMFIMRHRIQRCPIEFPYATCSDQLLAEPENIQPLNSSKTQATDQPENYCYKYSRFDILFPQRAERLKKLSQIPDVGEKLVASFDALDIPCTGFYRAAFFRSDRTFSLFLVEGEEAIPIVNQEGVLEKLLLLHLDGQLCLHTVEPLAEKRYISLPTQLSLQDEQERIRYSSQELIRRYSCFASHASLNNIRVSAFIRLVCGNVLGRSDAEPVLNHRRWTHDLFSLQFSACFRSHGYPSNDGLGLPLSPKNENTLREPPSGPLELKPGAPELQGVLEMPRLIDYETRNENKRTRPGDELTCSAKPCMDAGFVTVNVPNYFHPSAMQMAQTTGRLELTTRCFPIHHSDDILWGLPMGEQQGGLTTSSLVALYNDGDVTAQVREKPEKTGRRSRGGRSLRGTTQMDQQELMDRKHTILLQFQAEASEVFNALIKSKLTNEEQSALLHQVEGLHDRYLSPLIPPQPSCQPLKSDYFQGIDRASVANAGWNPRELIQGNETMAENELAPVATELWWSFMKWCSCFSHQSPGHKQLVNQLKKIGSDYLSDGSVTRGAGGPLIKPSSWTSGNGSGRDATLSIKRGKDGLRALLS